nr:hypothetical protein [Tanacetum cinerariifolium]
MILLGDVQAETILTQPIIGKGASSVAKQIEEETSSTIKLEDPAKLVSHVQPSFKYLDLPEDDLVIITDDSNEDDEDKVHATKNVETKDTLKNKAKDEAALLKAQPSFPNVGQLNELLVMSLQTKFSNIVSAHDFSSSLLTELKDLPSKFNELTEEVNGLKQQVHELEIELPGDSKEIPSKLEEFTKTVTSLTSQVAELKTLQWELLVKFISLPVQVASVQAMLKTLDDLPGLLLNVTKALNKFTLVLDFASLKARDQSVPSAGEADTMPAEEEKNTNQAIISQLFQIQAEKNAEKNAEKENPNNQQPKPITPPAITIIPHIITTTTTQMQSPQNPQKGSSQPGGAYLERQGQKGHDLKKFDFVTKDGEHVHLTEEQISAQKKIKEEAKAEAARREGEMTKEELIDLLSPEVVNKYYNDKLQANKRLNSSVQYKDNPAGIVLNQPVLGIQLQDEEFDLMASERDINEIEKVNTNCILMANLQQASSSAKFMIVVGADNRPPMLDKPMYESWKTRMELYIQGKDHGRIILNSNENGSLIWPTVEQEDSIVRLKTYEELSDKEKL